MTDGTDPWDEVAADWDHDPGPRQYAAAAYGSLIAEIDQRGLDLEGMRVLDFGAGTGLLAAQLEPLAASIVAVDTSAEMRQRLAEKAERWRSVSVADRVPVGADQFDLIVCSSVLGFVDDLAACVGELVSTLAPGGLFVQWDWERSDADPNGADDDPHGLSRDEMERVLTKSGLSEVTVATGFVLTVDDMTMSPLMGVGVRAERSPL